jgi:hypothetical protein
MNSATRSTVVILGSVALGASVGVIVGYVMMLTMPCRWFGSSFEGACGYGAMYASIGVGALITIVLAALLIMRYLPTRHVAWDVANGRAEAGTGPTRDLVIGWRVTFALLILPWGLSLLSMFTSYDSPIRGIMAMTAGPIGGLLAVVLRVVHAAACFRIARPLGQFPPAIGLVALLGDIGAVAVHVFLSVRLRRQRSQMVQAPTGGAG